MSVCGGETFRLISCTGSNIAPPPQDTVNAPEGGCPDGQVFFLEGLIPLPSVRVSEPPSFSIRFRWFRFGVRRNSRAFKPLCGGVVGATTVQMKCDSPRMVGDASCASYGVETFDALDCVKTSHRNPLEYVLAILPALVLQQLPCCLEAFLVDGPFSVHECCAHIVYRRRELSRDHRELRIFFQNGPTLGFRTTICEAIEVIDHVHRRKMSTVGPSLVR